MDTIEPPEKKITLEQGSTDIYIESDYLFNITVTPNMIIITDFSGCTVFRIWRDMLQFVNRKEVNKNE